MGMGSGRLGRILHELQNHLPFTIFFTGAGIVLAGLLTYGSIISGTCPVAGGGHEDEHEHLHGTEQIHAMAHEQEHTEPEHDTGDRLNAASKMLFHVLHPVHLLLSAMATSAMFRRHEKKYLKAILVGFVGSTGVCGLSDVFMPYLCGHLLNAEHMHFHWCLIQHPGMVVPFVMLGIFAGLLSADAMERSTVFSHSGHVFVSSVASLFYLISFGVQDWYTADRLPSVFAIVILCVIIPCCLSDILFPLAMTGDNSVTGHSCCAGHGGIPTTPKADRH